VQKTLSLSHSLSLRSNGHFQVELCLWIFVEDKVDGGGEW